MQHIGHSLTVLRLSNSMTFRGNHARGFYYLRRIEHVSLSHNGLKSLPLGLNHIASSVKTLDFSYNAMKSIASMEGVNFVRLQILNLERNKLTSLDELIQYSWGSSLPKHKYLGIYLASNPWHCNGSLIWLQSSLYKMRFQIIYAKPSLKAYIANVQMMVCKSPDTRHGTPVVPRNITENIYITIHSLSALAGEYYWHWIQCALLHLVNHCIENYLKQN